MSASIEYVAYIIEQFLHLLAFAFFLISYED